MKTNTRNRVIPGLSLSGKDIRSRLKNKTIQRIEPMESEYVNSEELIAITKMNKVEREMAYRNTQEEIRRIQRNLDIAASQKKQKQEEERINKLANERLAQIRKDENTNAI